MRRYIILWLLTVSALAPLPAEAALLSDIVQFSLQPQALETALLEFSKQSGVQVFGPAEGLTGKQAPAVRGEQVVEAALKALLEGSGLTYRRVNESTVAIGPEAVESAPTGARHGSILGRVAAADATAPLAGALVRILETGQMLATDELGQFHVTGLAEGEYTLAISYIGFAEKLWRVPATVAGGPREFRLESSAFDVTEITVFGTRSARAKALNLQRSADNSASVISADLIGNFNDATIAEALRRAPGIAFTRGSLGDGANVRVRGLAPELSNVQLNGLTLPNMGKSGTRVQNLNNFLADNIESITINESLLPSHDSAGTGGLIEIETRSPLGHPHRYASFSAEGGRKGRDFGDDVSASATLSGTFGSERAVGLSASAQYLQRSGRTHGYNLGLNYGQYLPLSPFGTPTLDSDAYIDPRTAFPYEAGVVGAYAQDLSGTYSQVDLDNLALTLSGEWQVSPGSRLQLDVQRSQQVEDNYSRSVGLNFPTAYALSRVANLGGEWRQALGWSGLGLGRQQYTLSRGAKTLTDTVSLRGSSSVGRWQHTYTAGFASGSSQAPENFLASFYQESFGQPVPVDAAFIGADAVDPVEGRVISVFGRRDGRGYPLPLLTDAGWEYFNDPSTYLFGSGQNENTRGSNDRYTAELGSRWNLEQRHLKYLEAGVHLESARFTDRTASTGFYNPFIDVEPFVLERTAADLGLDFTDSDLGVVGVKGRGFEASSQRTLQSLVGRLDALTSGPVPYLQAAENTNPLANEQTLRENSIASYLQSRVDFGKLSFVGGVRVNRADVESRDLNTPFVIDENGNFDFAFMQAFTRIVASDQVVTDVLPRLQLNYRQTDNLTFRGSYYFTIARPELYRLQSERSIGLILNGDIAGGGPNRDQPVLSISEGNPGLEPVFTHNYDLGAEYYTEQIGLMKVSFFYKEIENLLEFVQTQGTSLLDGVELPDHPYFRSLPDDLVVRVQRPVNSDEKAGHWGVTVAAERQFSFLPGFWSGFGIYGNFSYSSYRRPQRYTWFTSPVFDKDGNVLSTEAVELNLGKTKEKSRSGTAALTYTRGNVDGSLAYSWQERNSGLFAVHGLTTDTGAFEGLDLRVQYQLNGGRGNYRIYFEGTDLLKSAGAPDNLGETGAGGMTYRTSATYYGGRNLRVGVAVSF